MDKNNTSGFFNEEGSGLVAIYTNEGNRAQPGKPQVQSIAYSKDKGRTWTKYEGNPVLFPTETLDFRDPKVFWHDESSMWIMVLAVRDRVEFYTSPNLKEWSFASEFGSDIPHIHRGIFECPDIFRIRVDEDDNTNKWILIHISDSKSEIIAEFEISTAVKYGFKVRKSSNQETIIGYNISNGELFVDRTKSSAIDFLSDFTAIHKAPMKPEHGRVQLSIYVDWSSVEVFGKQGAGTLRHWRRTKGRIASNQ